jgi:hypothetical protein
MFIRSTDLGKAREKEGPMIPRSMKYHSCPRCSNQARLLMDINEKEPQRDKKQNLLYYCTKCNHPFAVDANGQIVSKP